MTARRMIIMLLLVAVVFGGIFGMQYLGRKGMAEYFDNFPVPAAVITTTSAEAQTWQSKLEAPGTLVAIQSADVSSETGGIVTQIHVESGDSVTQGDPMINLDDASDKAELAKLGAQADLARINRERRQKLFKLEAISQSDLEVAQSEYDAARAAVNAQRAKLAHKKISAPFSGDIGILRVSVGSYLPPGEPAVSLRAIDPLFVDFELPERHIGKIRAGQHFVLTTEAYGPREFTGEVEAVEPQIDAATRNIRIRGKISNADHALKPGQFAQVKLALPEQAEVIVVPRTAIDYSAYGTAIFVVTRKAQSENAEAHPESSSEQSSTEAGADKTQDELIATKRFVTLGDVRGDTVSVTKGLRAGERIATSGLLKIRSGQAVSINNEITPSSSAAPTPPEG